MATTVTPGTLRTKAQGAFDSVDDEAIQLAIDEAGRYISAENWSGRLDDGVFYLACHILAELATVADAAADGGGAAATLGAVPAGPVSTEKILSWSATYSVSEGGVFDDALATTSWGRMFLARESRVFSGRVI